MSQWGYPLEAGMHFDIGGSETQRRFRRDSGVARGRGGRVVAMTGSNLGTAWWRKGQIMSQSQELPGNAESAAAGPDEPERDLSARKMKRRRAQEERLQSRQEDLDWRKGMRQQDMDWRTGNRQEDVAWRQMEARRSSRCAALHAATHLASQGMSPAQVLELAEQFAAWIEIRGGHPTR